MRLIDCFLQIIAVTAYLSRAPDGVQVEFEAMRRDIEGLLAEGQHRAARAGFSPEEFDLARFAVCAWVDETVRISPWPGREEWSKVPLQREYYRTANAGEEFYTRLEHLDPDDAPAREVFATCLALGFKGRLFHEEHRAEWDRVRRDNLVALWGDSYEDADLDRGRLFPQAYTVSKAGRRRWRYLSLGTLLGILIPAVAFVSLFIIYRYLLNKELYDFFHHVV